jgi:deoxyadenosine/deoxycytidine kinase
MVYNYIAIEGNIGAGKTTLSSKMAENFNAKLILEQFEDNPFLPKFYDNPARYAFQVELTFLAERFQQLTKQLTDRDLFKSFTISDYFIHKSLIFAGQNLVEPELSLYTRLFNIITTLLPSPDLLVYLYVDIDNLKKNISKRGRSYEQKIEYSYLEKINKGYFDYFRQQQDKRILIVDVNNLDFLHNKNDYNKVVDLILAKHEIGVHRILL